MAEIESGTNVETVTEKIAVMRRTRSTRWHFAPVEVSHLFEFVLSPHWAELAYADYYQTFWLPLTTDLKPDEGPKEIHIVCEYTFGVETIETIDQYEAKWRTLTETPMMFYGIDTKPSSEEKPFVHMRVLSWSIEELSIDL